MSKKTKVILISIFIFLVIIVGGSWLGITYWFNQAHHGKLVAKLDSPNHNYTVSFFNISASGGGPSVGPSLRVEVRYNNIRRKTKTIYYDYNTDYSISKIKWVNNRTIEINGHRLNVLKDTYNWQKDPNWGKEHDN